MKKKKKSNSKWLPTFPASITRILSESQTVLILWAIIKTVQFLKHSLIVCSTKTSVAESTDAVASSNTNIWQKNQ